MQKTIDAVRAWGKVEIPIFEAPVSTFIDSADITPLDTEDPEAREEMIEAFLSDGRLSHMTRIMAYHPKYLKCFRETHNFMFCGVGPLPTTWRHIIAIIAAYRHECQYLIDIHKRHYLELGGSANWLRDRDHLPPKLRRILLLNSIMAHQPYNVRAEHISRLVQGEHHWSLPELMHAIVIMAHIHTLCGFVFGVGCAPEIDSLWEMSVEAQSVKSCEPVNMAQEMPSAGVVVENDIIERLRNVAMQDEDEVSAEANMQEYKSDFEETRLLAERDPNSTPKPTFGSVEPGEDQADTIDKHVDFDMHAKSFHRTQLFSWSDHGFAMLNRYYDQLAQYLDTEFEQIQEMTYGLIGEVCLDSSPFRWAIWNYTHRITGMVDDEYKYGNVNKLIKQEEKAFVKIIVCYPQLAEAAQFWKILNNLKISEKVHVCMLAIEARKQAELVFVLQAVMQHMTDQRQNE
jgi:sestrin